MTVFAYTNLLEATASTVTATTETSTFEVENCFDWRTNTFWQGTGGGTEYVTVDLGSALAVDYWAIAGHDGGTQGATYKLQYSTDNFAGDTNDFNGTVTPSDDAVIIKTGTTQTKRYWRLEVVQGATAVSIGQLSIGARYDAPVGMRAGFVVPVHGYRDKFMNNLSDSGAFIGRSLIRVQRETVIDVTNLTLAQVRSDIEPLVNHALSKPFFFLWDETNYAAEAAYCWLRGDPTIASPSETFQSVTLPVGCLV